MKTITKEQSEKMTFVKENATDVIFWVDNVDTIGEYLFSFEKKKIYNLFADYPMKLSKNERELFAKENPYWVDFFKDRFKDDTKENHS